MVKITSNRDASKYPDGTHVRLWLRCENGGWASIMHGTEAVASIHIDSENGRLRECGFDQDDVVDYICILTNYARHLSLNHDNHKTMEDMAIEVNDDV